MFDTLFQILSKSAIFGFALAFAGTLFFLGNKLHWWDVQFSPEHTSYIFYAMLVGYGVLIAHFLRRVSIELAAILGLLASRIARWRDERNVMDRLDGLTPRQLGALYFISQNPSVIVHGSLYEEPLRGLCERKFLFASSQKPAPQGFKVNKAVYKEAGKIAARLPPHLLEPIAAGQAPWKK